MEEQSIGKAVRENSSRNLISQVGSIVSRERAHRGLTIGDLARQAGLSNGLLSQLERGIGNPSIETLANLARALGIPIGSFFEPASATPDDVVHPHTRSHLVLADKRMTYQLLVPDLKGALSMLYIELPANFSNADAPFCHHGEEVVLVLSGSVEIHIGDRTRLLRAGDSIRFSSAIDHWYQTFNERVVAITAQTPPSF
jgi:transcriptional regulator with XRE-family HTH domain